MYSGTSPPWSPYSKCFVQIKQWKLFFLTSAIPMEMLRKWFLKILIWVTLAATLTFHSPWRFSSITLAQSTLIFLHYT